MEQRIKSSMEQRSGMEHGVKSMEHTRFRFEDLEIWQRSVVVARKLFALAQYFEEKKLYRFADQLRGAGLSMPNNIAEGSGSNSRKEFVQFLNIARRSTFENASMIMVFAKDQLIEESTKDEIVSELYELCKMITGFAKSIERQRGAENSTEHRA